MELIKKNLFLVISVVVMIILSVIASVIIRSYHKDIDKYAEQVKNIVEAEKSFVTSPYALTTDNVLQVEKNYEGTVAKFREMIDKLNERYPSPEVNSDMTPLKFKLYLRQVCIKMENLLRGEDVALPDSLKWFSFDRYMQPDVLPNNEEIKSILNQLEIIQELIYIISQSEVKSLDRFSRSDDINLTERKLYGFMPFTLSLSGNVNSIRRFMNLIPEARYFYMVRNLDLEASEPRMNDAPDVKRNKLTPKHERLLYSAETIVKVDFVVDYFEFQDKE